MNIFDYLTNKKNDIIRFGAGVLTVGMLLSSNVSGDEGSYSSKKESLQGKVGETEVCENIDSEIFGNRIEIVQDKKVYNNLQSECTHNKTKIYFKEPTCTEDGYYVVGCTDCGEKNLPGTDYWNYRKTGHLYKERLISQYKASCRNPELPNSVTWGNVCTKCGDIKNVWTDAIDTPATAYEHDWDEGVQSTGSLDTIYTCLNGCGSYKIKQYEPPKQDQHICEFEQKQSSYWAFNKKYHHYVTDYYGECSCGEIRHYAGEQGTYKPHNWVWAGSTDKSITAPSEDWQYCSDCKCLK